MLKSYKGQYCKLPLALIELDEKVSRLILNKTLNNCFAPHISLSSTYVPNLIGAKITGLIS